MVFFSLKNLLSVAKQQGIKKSYHADVIVYLVRIYLPPQVYCDSTANHLSLSSSCVLSMPMNAWKIVYAQFDVSTP